MSTPQRKKQKLQIMSDFATMRFVLKNYKLYQEQKKVKRSPFTRFGKTPAKRADQPLNKSKSHQAIKQKPQQSQKQTTQTFPMESDSSFSLKFLDKLSNEHILIGNQYQLDMLKIGTIMNNYVDIQYKWSIQPSEAISSISIQLKYGLIAVGGRRIVQILKYNLKRQNDIPQIVVKSSHDQDVLHVRFIRNMSLFIIFQTKIQFYRINLVCQKMEITKHSVHKFNYGPNFKLYFVPHAIDNSLNLYFYQNKVKPEQSSKFGLWMQMIEVKSNSINLTVGKLLHISSIDVKDRKLFAIYNYSKDLCLLKFQYNIIAIKNGFIIDECHTNFHNQSSFIQYIQSNRVVLHYRNGFIDVYSLSMNMTFKPERIALQCIDSFQFQSPTKGTLFKIIELKPQTYTVFYQLPPKNIENNPQLNYMLSISNEIDLKQKIDHFYPKTTEIQHSPFEQLQDRCSQAKKFGMTNKEAFYQLWKRSNKSSITDFQILISTKDYTTIQKQIEQKLKKQSMSIRQIIKIYHQTLQMLHQRVYSPQCTVNILIQYSSCQFLLKKLDMYRFLMKMEQESHSEEQVSEKILINIKDYYQFSDMSILNELVDLMNKFLTKKSNQILIKIKGILLYFRLIFRLNYIQTIDRIINVCKLRILELLQLIPELLPYLYQNENEGLGIWKKVSEQQKESNLFLNDFKTLQNKQKVDEFSRNIWFKRNLYTGHGVITIARQKISQHIQKQNNFEQIFYKFLYRLYNLKIYDQNLKKLILYIETKYPLLPDHLKGKFQLYIILYQMFQNFSQEYKLQNFLKFKEFQLFKMFFQRQKIEKGGFILKKICPLYQKVLKDGKQIFNQGIYNYFSSPQSSVADLKCILNKLNNQKNQFHITAQKLYEVLINAVMKKIKIGTQNDTPIDQILVYIQNIPFPIHNESIMDNLQYIQQINYESQILAKIKVNMSLQQIVDNPKKIIEMMVQYEVNRHNIHNIKQYRSLKVHAYKILAEVQCRKSNIYGDKQHIYSLKIFLITVMTNIEMIKLCSNLLKDSYLIAQFGIDIFFIEEVVIYLYHWKQSKRQLEEYTYFLAEREYLQTLTQLLDKNSEKRKFIQFSIRYAELLTFQNGFKIRYPLFDTDFEYPRLNDFIINLNSLQAKQMAQINLESIFQIIIKLKKLKEGQLQDTTEFSIYESKLKIELYENLIVHLIQVKELKAALENIIILISLPNDYPEFNIIYPILILEKLLPELLQNTCLLVTKLISYYYYNPLQLTLIIKHIFSKPFSSIQLSNYFTKKLNEYENKPIFCLNNPIINKKLKIELQNSKQKNQVKNKLVEWCLKRIIDVNNAFIKNYSIHIIFRLMCHNPIVVSKFIWCKQEGINVKSIRSLISFMSLQLLFDSESVLQNGKKIFEIIFFKYQNSILFFSEIVKYHLSLLKQNIVEKVDEDQDQPQNTSIKLIKQCIILFNQKLHELKQVHRQIIQKKQGINYQLFVSNPDQYRDRPRTEYIFDDRDDGYQNLKDQLRKIEYKKNKNSVSDLKKSQHSDTLNKKMSQIKIPTNNNRTRKYSEYFPEMVDKILTSNPKLLHNINSEKQIIKPNNNNQDNDSNSQIPATSSIMEESIENLSSFNFKNCKEERIPTQNAIPCLQKQCSIQQLNDQHGEKQDFQFMLNNSSVISQEMSQTKSIKNLFDQDMQSQTNFKINLISNNNHVPVMQMMETLLSTTIQQSKSFDLTLLRIQSRKPSFSNYLKQLLQQIYYDSLVTFELRISLILAIAIEFQFKYFDIQCIQIFKKISKIKQIEQLPFNLIETVSIKIIFQPTIRQAFHLFLKNIIKKINTINIFQIIKFVFEVFGKSQFKDELIVEFIILKISQSFSDSQKHKKDMLNNILLTLFQYSEKCPQLIEKKCEQLLKGDQMNKKIAQTLQKLLQDYRLQTL